MAPKVKILSHLIVGILSCIAVAIAQTSTPDNTSTTTKTTLPPTTSVIVTTTRSTPTATPSPIPVNEDVGQCTCDLTGNACDINCCCDSDCSSDDKLAFSTCVDQTASADNKACVQSKTIYTSNTPYEVETTQDGLFCVIIDNYKQRNFYTVPSAINSTEEFDTYRDKYGGPSYQAQPTPDAIDLTNPRDYKSGDPVLTVFESNSLGVLGLPQALTSSECLDSNPAAYLTEQTVECTRTLTDLRQQCETQMAVSALTYYSHFKVVSSPLIFKTIVVNDSTTETPTTVAGSSTTTASVTPTTTTTVVSNSTMLTVNATVTFGTAAPVSEVPDLYNSSALIDVVPLNVTCYNSMQIQVACNFSSTQVPPPTYDLSSQVCSNVVTQVQYIVVHNSSGGITQVSINLVLSEITQSSLPLTQKFSTYFRKESESAPYLRSGNPGYIAGQPVMAGQLTTQTDDGTTKQAIAVSDDRDQWMTIVTSSPLGECRTQPNNRVSVKFGENLRSGCYIKLSQRNFDADCKWIQDAILNALLGGDNIENKYVARFGNTAPESVGDWVPVQVEGKPVGNPNAGNGECPNVVMGLHIEIVYANVGSLSNPQAKVIGAKYKYASPQTIKYLCTGRYCQPGMENLTQNFEVVSSVAFIDASEPAAPSLAEKPQFTAKLPRDFFHPFYSSSSESITQRRRLVLAFSGVALIITTLSTRPR